MSSFNVVRAFTRIPSTVRIIVFLGLGELVAHARRVPCLEQQMNQKTRG